MSIERQTPSGRKVVMYFVALGEKTDPDFVFLTIVVFNENSTILEPPKYQLSKKIQ